MMLDFIQSLDGLAGFAALLNGLLLWPIVKTLKSDHAASKAHQDNRLDHHDVRLDNHASRITRLESE